MLTLELRGALCELQSDAALFDTVFRYNDVSLGEVKCVRSAEVSWL